MYVVVSTVEVHSAEGQSDLICARLESLIELLRRTSGCVAYTLTQCPTRQDRWIATGYWCSVQSMEAHFRLPCLSALFDLTAERLARSLCFGTFPAA